MRADGVLYMPVEEPDVLAIVTMRWVSVDLAVALAGLVVSTLEWGYIGFE